MKFGSCSEFTSFFLEN